MDWVGAGRRRKEVTAQLSPTGTLAPPQLSSWAQRGPPCPVLRPHPRMCAFPHDWLIEHPFPDIKTLPPATHRVWSSRDQASLGKEQQIPLWLKQTLCATTLKRVSMHSQSMCPASSKCQATGPGMERWPRGGTFRGPESHCRGPRL